jgi:hypothetical protein
MAGLGRRDQFGGWVDEAAIRQAPAGRFSSAYAPAGACFRALALSLRPHSQQLKVRLTFGVLTLLGWKSNSRMGTRH